MLQTKIEYWQKGRTTKQENRKSQLLDDLNRDQKIENKCRNFYFLLFSLIIPFYTICNSCLPLTIFFQFTSFCHFLLFLFIFFVCLFACLCAARFCTAQRASALCSGSASGSGCGAAVGSLSQTMSTSPVFRSHCRGRTAPWGGSSACRQSTCSTRPE